MEIIASIFCIGLLMFYLLFLIALVVAPLFKQRKLKPSTGIGDRRAWKATFRADARR